MQVFTWNTNLLRSKESVCKYKYWITVRYSTLDEKHAFASPPMFDIQYLIKEWLDKRAILYPRIKHVLKQGREIVTVSVHRKWLITYWLALGSAWRSVILVSLNVGGDVRLIKPAKLYMCMQTHYKHDENGRTAPSVRGHGSLPLSHSGNVVTRIGLHTNQY